jgi:outer membrane autotransporter protein
VAGGGDGRVRGDASSGSSNRSERAWSLSAGADTMLVPGIVGGVALSGGRVDGSLANGLGSMNGEVLQAGAYARGWFGPLALNAALAYTYMDASTTRAVPVLGVPALNSRTDVHGFSGRFEAAYTVSDWSGLALSPYAAGQGSSFRVPNAIESSPSDAPVAPSLLVNGRDYATLRGELGLRADTTLHLGATQLAAFARGAWALYGAQNTTFGASFFALPGTAITTIGATHDRSTALVSAGLDFKLMPAVSFSARFDGEYGSPTSNSSGTARLGVTF